MSYNNKISVIDELNKKYIQQRDSIKTKNMISNWTTDFETAINAAKTGKYQYLLILAIVPASWSSMIDTGNMSMILPSAECDLNLSLLHKGLLNAMIYIGMVTSGFMWGYIADVKGRKKVILYCYMADGICNVLSGFSQNLWTLVFFKFLSGFLVCGPYASLMAYCSEFFSSKDRAKIPILVGFFMSFGTIIGAGLAWLVIPRQWSIVLWDGFFVYNSWRIFLSLCGLPALIGVTCLSLFPESPKFLMIQNRNEEALEILKEMYSMNTGLSKDDFPIQALYDENLNKPITEQSHSLESQIGTQSCLKNGIQQIKPLFRNPYLPRMLLFLTIQFVGLLVLNTLRLWQPQLFATMENYNSLNADEDSPTFCEILDTSMSLNRNKTAALLEEESSCESITVPESMYTDTIIVSATSSLFILSASIFVHFMEHKYLLFISYGSALLCLIGIIWSTSVLLILTLTCLYVGLLNATCSIVISATVLLFPTSLRTMAVSLEMVVGRMGSLIGNLVFPILLQYGCVVPVSNLASCILLCIILSYFLPSTRKHAV